nr:DnaT-like ssDNA-binding protein [uncultured Roseovarius sp.]
MTLTVEDGSIVANADSYVTLDAYHAYGEARGWTFRDTDSEDEADLRRGFDALNRNWSYRGAQVDDLAQVGAWPRYIPDGRMRYAVPSDSIPADIQNAQFELAYLIKGGLDPFATLSGVVKSASAGPARVEFLGGQGRPSLTAVNGLLRPYLLVGAGQSRAVRG